VWLPNKLERQAALLEAHPDAAMVCGPSQYWSGWTGRPEDIARDRVNDLGVAPGLVKPPTMLVTYLRGRTHMPNPSNIVIRREALERVGGFEESFVGAVQPYEDQAFLAKVHLKERVFVADECWDRYRKHPDSSVSLMKNSGRAHAARLFYLNWLENYLVHEHLDSGEVWQALRAALWPYRHPRLASLVDRG